MWKLLHDSVPGTSHRKDGLVCQDAAFGTETRTAAETVLIVAVADGAGSATFADVAARLSCTHLTQLIGAAVQDGFPVATIDREQMLRWHGQVVGLLEEEAYHRGAELRQFACTLLTAVLGESCAVFSQVGDGAIVVPYGDGYQPVFWPQSGEYVNTTHFVTDSQLRERLEFTSREGMIDELALFTDGLQMLALNYADRQAHAPFFAPLFRSLHAAPTADDLLAPLRRFLDSPRVNDRTDDDKTLLLAARRSGDGSA